MFDCDEVPENAPRIEMTIKKMATPFARLNSADMPFVAIVNGLFSYAIFVDFFGGTGCFEVIRQLLYIRVNKQSIPLVVLVCRWLALRSLLYLKAVV